MRRTELLGFAVLLLTACGQSPKDDAQRLVRISRFDCVTHENMEGSGDFPWSKGISSWSGGGPGGAAWNAGELRCAVEFETPCSQGSVYTELRIGAALGGSRQTKIERAGSQRVTLTLAPDQWSKHFDQGTPSTQRFPYKTATFSASVVASCDAPETFGPGTGPRLEFADDRHFTAGFATGE